jgi:hypothetical protein
MRERAPDAMTMVDKFWVVLVRRRAADLTGVKDSAWCWLPRFSWWGGLPAQCDPETPTNPVLPEKSIFAEVPVPKGRRSPVGFVHRRLTTGQNLSLGVPGTKRYGLLRAAGHFYEALT